MIPRIYIYKINSSSFFSPSNDFVATPVPAYRSSLSSSETFMMRTKWMQEFKSWTKLFPFQLALMHSWKFVNVYFLLQQLKWILYIEQSGPSCQSRETCQREGKTLDLKVIATPPPGKDGGIRTNRSLDDNDSKPFHTQSYHSLNGKYTNSFQW